MSETLTLTRYDCTTGGCGDDECCGTYGVMEPDKTGDYVRLADVAALFTAEDVAVCRSFNFNFYGNDSDSVEVSREACEHLQRIAARIRALLPA